MFWWRSNLGLALDQERDSKWVTIDTSNRKLVLYSEATEALRAHGADELNLITIIGPAKMGKSFLMNTLVDEPGFFAVSGGQDPTTVGVDLSPVKPLAEFTGRSADEGKVAFVDVEGQGDRGVDYDVMLAAMLLLVSKVVIFNWKDAVRKDDILNKLGVLVEAARMIKKQDGDTTTDAGPIFGHLLVVLRDQEANVDIANVVAKLFAPETCSALDEATVNRNRIRSIINEAFASPPTVVDLPPPVACTARQVAGAFAETDVVPAFTAKIGELKRLIVEKLDGPLTLCGRPFLSAADVAEFVPLLAKEMNNGQKRIVPQSLFLQLDQRRAEAAADAAIQAFDAWDKAVRDRMPMAPDALDRELEAELELKIETIEAQLAGVAADKLQLAFDLFERHVNNSHGPLAQANEVCIANTVGISKAVAIKELDRLRAAGMRREEVEAPDKLEADFHKAKDVLCSAFHDATAAFRDVPTFSAALGEVNAKVADVWDVILRQNKHLQEKARLEEKAKQEAAARKQAEKERQEEAVARKAAEEKAKRAETNARAGWGGGAGDVICKLIDLVPLFAQSPDPDPVPVPDRVVPSLITRLSSMARGTTNSNGSRSMGDGYTQDRNGRWHDSTGKFCKPPSGLHR